MKKILIVLFLFTGFWAKAQPEIKGGLESFVLQNTVYPPYSLQNCIQGMVRVSFKLTHAGEIYYSEIKSGIGTDLDDEALRLIRLSSGKWKVPEGYDTTVALLVPVNFKLSGYNCDLKTPQEIKRAIAAYKASEGLSNAIQNFYRNKEKGIYNKADEPKMQALKKELGYDDEFLQSKIRDGKEKLKQKDRQGACEDFLFVRHMGSDLADDLLKQYCN